MSRKVKMSPEPLPPNTFDLPTSTEGWRATVTLGARKRDYEVKGLLARAEGTPTERKLALCLHGHGHCSTMFSWHR